MEKTVPVSRQSMQDEVLKGLGQFPKELPSKFFYDEKGSELFERITHLKEYYLGRTEQSILETNIHFIADCIGSRAMLIELGSGSSRKTRLLLDKLPSLSAYIPVDISKKYLLKVVNGLRRDYPQITIIPVFADYTSRFELPDLSGGYEKQVVFFPGSTIGNFRPERARSFLKLIAAMTEPESAMLIGVDLKKDKEVLEAAYNDSEGVTAQFNKNMLVRMNRELNADFEVGCFEHRAFYNEDQGRIEMHLVSRSKQKVTIGDKEIIFEKGENIHTENSYKYSLDDFKVLVNDWYTVQRVWTDKRKFFSLQYLERKYLLQ